MKLNASPHVVIALLEADLPPELVRVAMGLATGPGASVTLLRVIAPSRPVRQSRVDDLLPLPDLAERGARVALARAASALDGLAVAAVVLVGANPARELATWLRTHPAAWIIMAEPDRSPRHLLRRYPIDAIRRAGSAPVITVHAARPGPTDEPDVRPVPMDGRLAGSF